MEKGKYKGGTLFNLIIQGQLGDETPSCIQPMGEFLLLYQAAPPIFFPYLEILPVTYRSLGSKIIS